VAIHGWHLARMAEAARAATFGVLFPDPIGLCAAHDVTVRAAPSPTLWASRTTVLFTPLRTAKATDFRILTGLAHALLLRRDVPYDVDDALRLAAEIAIPRIAVETWPLELVAHVAHAPASVVASWATWTRRTPRLSLVRTTPQSDAPLLAALRSAM